MAFVTVPFNMTGPSYQSRSKPLSAQQTKMWYPQLNKQGKDDFVLLPFPGLKFLGNAVGADRGFHRMAEVLFQVKGNTLFSIDKTGIHTSKGTIPSNGKCIMADDGINLFIVASDITRVFQYDGSNVTEVLDPEITGAKSVDFINNQFLYTKDRFTTVSDVGNGASASGLNIIGEEHDPDDLVRDFVFDTTIWRMGCRSTLGWWNSGEGQPPIERLDGQIFSVGLGAINSVAKNDEAFYWLGDDNAIYRATGGASQRISTDAISNFIERLDRVDDATGYTFTMQGQNFYWITFPSGNKTFIINESLGEDGWFELSSGVGVGELSGRYQGSSIINVYGKNIVADETNGNIYELDFDTFNNNGETLHRTRVSSSINGEMLNAKGKRIQMSRLELIMETGVGVIDGQGDNPRIMIEASYDGGRTFSAGTWARVGRLGEFVLQVEWFNLRSFYDLIIRISTSDPVNYSVYSATIDLRLAGK